MRTILNWETLQKVFFAVADAPPEDRPRILEEQCGDDASLRLQVESLLLALEKAEDVLRPLDVPRELASALETSLPERIGPYQVLSLLGRGGMGAVYLAERVEGEFRQKVAIKCTRHALLDPGARARFRAERQILANLSHPHIAKLLDGGTTPDGTPYLVMEYIDGEPLSAFCRRESLPTRRCLQLFQLICSAVQAAHQNLVIHRDIKPANILVTREGSPVLLDFGIAKLLDPTVSGVTVAFTGEHERLMTPAYASPEQIAGRPVTTATDIYSLGALLHELLSGKAPFDLAGLSLPEIERVVSQSTPAPLTGDLGKIVEKAMHKDPARRYASADQLSEDIGRYLEGKPVTARPDSVGYRFSTWVRRNRALAATLAGLAVTVLALIVSLAVGLTLTREAQQRAERRFQEVRELASRFIFDFHDAIETLPGSTAARKMVLDRAIASLQGLESEAGDDNSFRLDLAKGWFRVAEIQFSPGNAHLYDAKTASVSLSRAEALLDKVLQAEPTRKEALLLLVSVTGSRSAISSEGQNATPQQMLERHQRVLARIEDALRLNSKDWELRTAEVSTVSAVASLQNRIGDLAACFRALQTAEQRLKALVQERPEDRTLRQQLASVLSRQGHILGGAYSAVNLGRNQDALDRYLESYAILGDIARQEPNNGLYARAYRISMNDLAALYEVMGNLDKSIALATQLKDAVQNAVEKDPMNAENLRDLGVATNNLGDVLTSAKRYEEAARFLRQALELRRTFAAKYPNTPSAELPVASTLQYIGEMELDRQRAAAAAASFREAIQLRERLFQTLSPSSDLLWRQTEAWQSLGQSLKLQKSPACAEAFSRAASLAADLARGGHLPQAQKDAPERLRNEASSCSTP